MSQMRGLCAREIVFGMQPAPDFLRKPRCALIPFQRFSALRLQRRSRSRAGRSTATRRLHPVGSAPFNGQARTHDTRASNPYHELMAGRLPPLPAAQESICTFECCSFGEWTAEDAIDVLAVGRESSSRRRRVPAGMSIVRTLVTCRSSRGASPYFKRTRMSTATW